MSEKKFQELYIKKGTLSDLDLLYGNHIRVVEEFKERFLLFDNLYINEFQGIDSKDSEDEFILERIPILERLVPFSILKVLTSRGKIKYLYNDDDVNLMKFYLEVCTESYNKAYDDEMLLKLCKGVLEILPTVSADRYVIEDYGMAIMFRDFISNYYKGYKCTINPMLNIVILEIISFYIGKIHGLLIIDELVEAYKKIIIYCEINVYGYIIGQIRSGFTVQLINDLIKYYNDKDILKDREYLKFIFFYIKETKASQGINAKIGVNDLKEIEEQLLSAYEMKLKNLINQLK